MYLEVQVVQLLLEAEAEAEELLCLAVVECFPWREQAGHHEQESEG